MTRSVLLGIGACTLLLGPPAGARPMDPVLSRLVVDPSCQSGAQATCIPDRALYTKLVSQLGFALAPHPVHAARTTGLSGFDLSLLASASSIDASAEYWRRGTRGDGDAAVDEVGVINRDPSSHLQLYTLELRKGFGFGIEAAASVGVMPRTSLVAWGADLRVAVLEGMRHGVWRRLPDASVGIALRQATGLGELSLGSLALDARLSRPLPSPAGFIVTPWVGYQWVRIGADSAQVDLTPNIGALEACGFAGSNVPGSAGAAQAGGASAQSGAGEGTFDASPLCRAGSGSDFDNSVSFGRAVVERHRALVGVSYRREILKLGAELVTDLLRPDSAQTDAAIRRALRCDAAGENCRPSPRQWTLVLSLGAAF